MAETQLGKSLGGRYRVDSPIAETSIGFIYCGTNTTVDREVTIKIVSPSLSDFKQEIFEEARKISRVSHPNVLAVTDLGEDDAGTLFVIYERFDGESLSAKMAANGQMPVERSIGIVRQIASTMTAVYPARPVYGTLRTDSVLLTSVEDQSEQVKVLNFVDAAKFKRANRNAVLTPSIDDANLVAPEAITSEDVDERCDVYSLGALLFRILAGEVPFPAESVPEALKKAMDDPPPPMSSFRSDLPEGLERVILTAMAKNPEMRYQTVAEFSNELLKFADISVATTPASTAAPAHDIWKTAFAVLAAISLLTVAFIYATSVRQSNPTTQLQPDANGQPVQPIGPATGIAEQNLASMQDTSAETISNSNTTGPPGTLPGGDGYDPWKNGGKPPSGAPQGGQVPTFDPNSPFMTNDGPCIPQPSGIVLCPAPANRAAKPTPTPKASAANANVSPKATPTPEVKPSPVSRPPAKPTPTPKPAQNGKPKNGDDDL